MTSIKKNKIFLKQNIWGPHYWFVLHSIARTYPEFPNEVSKRKYYDFIQNFPLFIPDEEISIKFSNLLDSFPVSPYLTCRESFIKWMYFIHNKINRSLEKDELTFEEATKEYNDKFRHPIVVEIERFRISKGHYFIILSLIFLIIIFMGMRYGG